MSNDNDLEDKVVPFVQKALKPQKKLFGTVEITDDNKVRIDMEDKSMVLEGTSAFDFGLIVMCAAKYVLTGETLNVEETE